MPIATQFLAGAARESDDRFSNLEHLIEPDIGERELFYVVQAVRSGWVSSLGPYVRKFEECFADYCGVRYAVSTCNGTAALHLALNALKIRKGDEVMK
jgi:perosamine synthetase